MKPDMRNMTPEPNWTAYFINSFQRSVCVCMCIPSTSFRIRLDKNVTAAKNHTQRRRNVGRFLFFAVYTVSKGSKRLVFLRTGLTVMELSLSNGPNRLRVSHHSPANGNRSVLRSIVFFCVFLEYRKLIKSKKRGNSLVETNGRFSRNISLLNFRVEG